MKTENSEIHLVPLVEEKISLFFEYIMKMAKYENLENEVFATQELLHESIFEKKAATVYIVEKNNKPIGFVLYTLMFSTFTGKPTLFLEDIYIDEEERGNGYGKMIFRKLMKIALDNNYGRIDWSCLDWNEPSIKFYLSMGAEPLSEWINYRLNEEAMKKFLK